MTRTSPDLKRSPDIALAQCKRNFEEDSFFPKIVALSDDGMKLSETIIWSKEGYFLGFLREKLSLFRIYAEISTNQGTEIVSEAVVVLATSPYSGFFFPLRFSGWIPSSPPDSGLL